MATSISRRAEGATPPIARPGPRTTAVGLALAVVAVLAALAVGAFFVSRSSLMHVRRIEVSGLSHLSASRVIRESGISTRSNALWLDVEEAEAALERDPWVARATVQRLLPWAVRISVVERVPVAEVASRGGYELLAGDGTSLGLQTRDPRLPPIVGVVAARGDAGAGSPQAAAYVLGHLDSVLRSMVKGVGVSSGGAVELHLQGGIDVNLGEPFDLPAKSGALAATLTWAKQQRVQLRTVDVSAPQTPAVRFVSS